MAEIAKMPKMYASGKCQMLSNTISGLITFELNTVFVKQTQH